MNGMVTYNVPHFFGEGALIPWGMLIVVHFFLSGLAAGSFLTSAAASFLDEEKYKKVAVTGAYLAVLPILLDVPVLIFDLDRPMRFFTLLFRASLTAPLTWGVWFLIGLGLFSLLNIGFLKGVASAKGAKTLILLVGSIFALGVSAYTAVALNIATNARPLWSNGLVIPIFMVASLTAGISAVTLVLSVSGDGREELSCLNTSNAVLLLSQFLMVAFLLMTELTGASISREAAGVILEGSMAPVFWVGLVIIGLAIPIAALWAGMIAKRPVSGTGVLAIISVMVLVGVFALRYIIVYGGQILPLT